MFTSGTPAQFSEFGLKKAKKHLWERRDTLENKLRFADSVLRNTRGSKLIATSGTVEADLFDDDSMAGSVSVFLGGQGAHCESSNVWWKPVEGILEREIHMMLSGLNNEFAITADTTKREYDYVFNELRIHCR